MTDRTELTDEVKTFIVQAVACFDSPSEVARAVKETFDIVVSRQAVEAYDPTKHQGRNLSEGYCGIFHASRTKFLADTAEIAVSHRSVRLRTLQRIASKAEAMGNLPLVADLMERAAKEMGNAFTNKRELSGPEGKAIPVAAELSFADLDQNERDQVRDLLERRAARSETSPPGA